MSKQVNFLLGISFINVVDDQGFVKLLDRVSLSGLLCLSSLKNCSDSVYIKAM